MELADYQKFCNIDTPIKERRKLNIGDIWINEAKCLKCHGVVRSKNTHDFVMCSCRSIGVDGGSMYAKRIGKMDLIENNIIMFNDVK